MATVGFIRVRKRKLKPKYRWSKGKDKWGCHYKIYSKPTESVTYDLVRAVRINGQPRHKFILCFGSPVSRWYKSYSAGSTIERFWARAFAGMAHLGFTEVQQFQIAEKLKRKGIPLPSVKECEEGNDTLIAFIRRDNPAAQKERPRKSKPKRSLDKIAKDIRSLLAKQRDVAGRTRRKNPRLRRISGLDRRNSRRWVQYESNISKA